MNIPEIVNPELVVGRDDCYIKFSDGDLIQEELLKVRYACFAHLKNDHTNQFHIGIGDVTSQLFGTDIYSLEYINDTSEFFKDICPHTELVPTTEVHKAAERYGVVRYDCKIYMFSIKGNEVHGSLLLGFLNILKAMTEFPFVPLNYYLLKRMYPELNYYQLLVLSYVCYPEVYLKYYTNNYGSHEPFYQSNITTIKGLSKEALVSIWKELGLFLPENSFRNNSTFKTDDLSSNFVMLPKPWRLGKTFDSYGIGNVSLENAMLYLK